MNCSPEELLSQEDFVRRMARGLLSDENSVDDVVQQTWLAVLRSPLDNIRNLRSWLGTVARNTSRERVRRTERARKRDRSAARADIVPSTAEVVEREETRKKVVDAVLALDEPYRSTILLRFYEGYSAGEIGRHLDVPLETVRTRIRRGLEKMRGRLDGEYGGNRDVWGLALAPLAYFGSGAGGGSAVATTAGAAVEKSATTLSPVFGPAAFKAGAALLVVGVVAVSAWLLSQPEQLGLEGSVPGPTVQEQTALPDPEQANPEKVPVQPTSSGALFVRGRVLDSDGNPVEGASIRIAKEADPGAGENQIIDPDSGKTCNPVKNLGTDIDGRFEYSGEDPDPLFVYMNHSGSIFLHPDPFPHDGLPCQGRWVTPPADGVDFTVRIKPTAKVLVRAVDEETGEWLDEFQCSFWSCETRAYMVDRTQAGLLEQILPITAEHQESFQTTLIHSSVPDGVRETVTLRPGQVRELTFSFKSKEGAVAEGLVLDPSGSPLEGVLVFFGNQIRMRGDEPFKPFEPKRIKDGTVTDSDGRFELKGTGRLITAWHADNTPVTVPASVAEEISLPPLGRIRGRLCDVQGVPRVGVEVALDRKRKAQTDSTGRFTFDDVEGGIRGLVLPDKCYFGVDVPPGETVDVDITGFVPEVLIELRSGGIPYLKPDECLLVGTGRLFSVQYEEAPGDGTLKYEMVIPGRYLLMTRSGRMATVLVDGGSVAADFGRCDLTVKAQRAARVYVVPADSSELVELLGGRIAPRMVQTSGTVTFDPLPEGKYAVGIDRQGIFATVEVKGRGTRVILPRQ